MTEASGSVLHQQALTVTGLFTGLVLAALVLILNSPRSFQAPFGPLGGHQYFEVLVSYVAIVGVMSSVAMLAFLEIAGGMAEKFSLLDQMGTTLFLASVFGFLGMLPLLLSPFSTVGASVVLIFEVVLVSTYFVIRRRRATPPRGS